MGQKPSKPRPPPLPEPPQAVVDSDLLIGITIMTTIVTALAIQQLVAVWWRSRLRQRQLIRCLGRSASCPALDQLPRGAKEACASMMADFEELKTRRSPARPSQQRSRASFSLASVRESEAIDPDAWDASFSSRNSGSSAGLPARRDISARLGGAAPPATEKATRAKRPHIIVLGDKQVGKSTVIDGLVKMAEAKGVDLRVHEGLPDGIDEMDAFLTQAQTAHLRERASCLSPPRPLVSLASVALCRLSAVSSRAALGRRVRCWWYGTPRWPTRAPRCVTTSPGTCCSSRGPTRARRRGDRRHRAGGTPGFGTAGTGACGRRCWIAVSPRPRRTLGERSCSATRRTRSARRPTPWPAGDLPFSPYAARFSPRRRSARENSACFSHPPRQTLCPMPEIAGLQKGDLFLAGSAQNGTNMSALWRRVEACAAPAEWWGRSLWRGATGGDGLDSP